MTVLFRRLSLLTIGLLLIGYVLGGKGFAYIGWPPLYIGEICLLISLTFLAFYLPTATVRLPWLVSAIALFSVWCFLQTIPYLEDFGFDALRDSALYGYSAFAIIVCIGMQHERFVLEFVRKFDLASRICIILLPFLIIFFYDKGVYDVGEYPLILLKTGDTGVHLVGILAFRLLGLNGHRPAGRSVQAWWLLEGLFWLCWSAVALWAMISRGAMLSFFASALVLLILSPVRGRLMAYMGIALTFLLALWIIDFRIELPRREISVAHMVAAGVSILSTDDAADISPDSYSDFEGTRRWRLDWWEDIVDYTVFGDYFWTGRGFGVNLAGIQGYHGDDGSLRSPHNIHMTVLGRAGVPGLALWLVVQIGFAAALAASAIRMHRRGHALWNALIVWVLMYWAASLTNASFDVYLEGPQGGIWFWCIMGFGLALLAVEKRAGVTAAPSSPAGLSLQDAASPQAGSIGRGMMGSRDP